MGRAGRGRIFRVGGVGGWSCSGAENVDFLGDGRGLERVKGGSFCAQEVLFTRVSWGWAHGPGGGRMGRAGRGRIGRNVAWDHPPRLFPEEGTRRCDGVARRRIGTGGAKVSHLLFGIDPGDREFRIAIMRQVCRRGGVSARGSLVYWPGLGEAGARPDERRKKSPPERGFAIDTRAGDWLRIPDCLMVSTTARWAFVHRRAVTI